MPACALTFGSGVVDAPDRDQLAVTALVPSAAEFGRDTSGSGTPVYGQRQVFCVLAAADGSQLTGTRLAAPE